MFRYLRLSKKHMPIVLSLLILLIGSSIAYAFWDNTTQTISDNEITLGEGAILTIHQQVVSDRILVPKGSFLGTNEIDEIVFSYVAFFNKEGLLNVTIDESSIRIGDGKHAFNDLVITQISSLNHFDDNVIALNYTTPFSAERNEDGLYEVTVYFRVFVIKPNKSSDYQEAYERLKGQTITFDILFEVLPIQN